MQTVNLRRSFHLDRLSEKGLIASWASWVVRSISQLQAKIDTSVDIINEIVRENAEKNIVLVISSLSYKTSATNLRGNIWRVGFGCSHAKMMQIRRRGSDAVERSAPINSTHRLFLEQSLVWSF